MFCEGCKKKVFIDDDTLAVDDGNLKCELCGSYDISDSESYDDYMDSQEGKDLSISTDVNPLMTKPAPEAKKPKAKKSPKKKSGESSIIQQMGGKW